MTIEERIDSFVRIGEMFAQFHSDPDQPLAGILKKAAVRAHVENPWFTPENIDFLLSSLAELLTYERLTKWLFAYAAILKKSRNPKTICVIMAGNIPMVGFHDFLCILMAGHRILVKLSSKDAVLLQAVIDILTMIHPEWKDRITVAGFPLSPFDAIIATGSNNSSRYFEYYFGKYPNILRKNRNSVAVITGRETGEELSGLADDILLYFGLGCRSVSKLYIPEGYDIRKLFSPLEKYGYYRFHHKFRNNYDYHKSVMLMNAIPFLDMGHVLITENIAMSSPVSVLYYEFYSDLEKLSFQLDGQSEQIQCIVCSLTLKDNWIKPGQAQHPALWDYADNKDTMKFLIEL
ncbi:MAG: acyl-CoA reductase [Bacteroidetes bacterium]|nr:acyl-CoA reductase [Bacteroidota bacterium]